MATFGELAGVSLSSDGTFAVVADYTKHMIRMITGFPGTIASSVIVSTLAGSGVPGYEDGV